MRRLTAPVQEEKRQKSVYLTSFIHRDELFDIAERWFCGHLSPNDGLRLTQILISDGFVLGETLENLAKDLLKRIYQEPIKQTRIHFKGELREALCRGIGVVTEREMELFSLYRMNPDFYYREAPVDGVMCLDDGGLLIGLYRIKRPRRIAEKANRKIANWIFSIVQSKAQEMAAERARKYGISLELLLTPESEMLREFVEAETAIAQSFSEGSVKFDRKALTINDVGGIKIVAGDEHLSDLEDALHHDPGIRILEKESFSGSFRAKSLVLECSWDPERAFRRYRECRCWQKYLNRGISENDLAKGLESMLQDPKTTINVELILSNFPDLVESELGNSIHEERIIAQRDSKVYQGYIPMNVEFLLEYLFAVGFSPQIQTDHLPIKLWGRYLPDTLISHMRQLYQLPVQDLFY
jgi:hypothetical protein